MLKSKEISQLSSADSASSRDALVLHFSEKTISMINAFFDRLQAPTYYQDLAQNQQSELQDIIRRDPCHQKILLLTKRQIFDPEYSPVVVIKGFTPEAQGIESLDGALRKFSSLSASFAAKTHVPSSYNVLFAVADAIQTTAFKYRGAHYKEVFSKTVRGGSFSSKRLHVDFPACNAPPDFTMLFGIISDPNITTEFYLSDKLLSSLSDIEKATLQRQIFYSQRDDFGPLSLMKHISGIPLLNFQAQIFGIKTGNNDIAEEALRKLEMAQSQMAEQSSDHSTVIQSGDIVIFDNLRLQHRAIRTKTAEPSVKNRLMLRLLRKGLYNAPEI